MFKKIVIAVGVLILLAVIGYLIYKHFIYHKRFIMDGFETDEYNSQTSVTVKSDTITHPITNTDFTYSFWIYVCKEDSQ